MKRIKLKEICEVVSGSTPKTGVAEYWDGDIDWITPAELTDETYIIKESQRKITCVAVQKTGLRQLPEGTVILSSRAPIGKVAIAGKEMYCNQGFKNIICSDKIDNRYLYWYLKGNTDFLNSLGRGATFKEISKEIVGNIEIPLPDLDKQINYANILKKCWDLILMRKKQIEVYDNLIKSRFVEMFGDPEHNTKRFPLLKLGKLCKVGSSKRIYQNEQSTFGIPFLRVSDLNDRIDKGKAVSELFIPLEKYEKLQGQGLVPQAGDILITSRGTIGKCYIVKDEDRFYFQDGMISWLSEIDKRVMGLYIAYLFGMPGMQKQITSLQAGSTVAYLSISMLKELDIMLPPLALQEQFVAFIRQSDKSKLTVQKSLEKLEILKKSLMQQYFGQEGTEKWRK